MTNLSNKLGLPIQAALEKRKVFTEALFSRPESLSALLPFDSYIEDKNLFLMKDGSLGAVYEVELLEHEAMTEKEVIEAVYGLKPWFSLPENCSLQVLFEQANISSFDKQIKELEESYPNAHPVSKMLFDSKLKVLKDSCKKVSEKTPMRRKAFLSIRYFPNISEKRKAKEYLSNANYTLYRQLKSFLRELRTFGQILKSLETSSELKLTKLDAEGLLDNLRKFFNPKTYYKRSFAKFNPRVSLSDQFLYNSPILDYPGIEREGVKTRVITLKTSPLYAYPGGMAYFLDLNFPFRLSLNFSFPTKAKVKRYFDMKEWFLQASPSAKAMVQKEEIAEAQDKLARNDRCLQLTFTVVVEGANDTELDDRVQLICDVFNNKLEAEVIVEDDIGLGLTINSLPLCYVPDSDNSTHRAIRILRSDALSFVPVFDSYRGHSDPMTFFHSRENNIVPFNLLEAGINNHLCIAADTGSGKSFIVNQLLVSAKRAGHQAEKKGEEPLIFILDKKCSYTMLAKYYDADITIFDQNNDVPFSPFRGIFDEEKVSFLTTLIKTAIELTSPSFKVESEHLAAITKALKLAYIKKCKRQGITYLEGELHKISTEEEVEISMEDFVIELGSLNDGKGEGMRVIIDPLLMKLSPFYGDGAYAKYFQSSPQKTKKSDLFYIYDLDALDSDPVLQQLMTLSVLAEIKRIIALPENQGRTGYLVLEEFAMLGRKNSTFVDVIIDYSETLRKKNVWLISLTPNPRNYFDLEIGRALWAASGQFLFLSMTSDNLAFLAENSSMFDEATIQIIDSLETVKGHYADVFYMDKSKNRVGSFRYHLNPVELWMAPTNAKDAREALNALSRFPNKWEALDYLATTYPNGVSA